MCEPVPEVDPLEPCWRRPAEIVERLGDRGDGATIHIGCIPDDLTERLPRLCSLGPRQPVDVQQRIAIRECHDVRAMVPRRSHLWYSASWLWRRIRLVGSTGDTIPYAALISQLR